MYNNRQSPKRYKAVNTQNKTTRSVNNRTVQTHTINNTVQRPSPPRQKMTKKQISSAQLNQKLVNQTPNRRKQTVTNKRIDSRKFEVQKRRSEEYRFYIKNKRHNSFRLFMSRFIIFCFVFAVLFSVSAATFYISLYIHPTVDRSDYYYYIGDDQTQDKSVRTVSYENVFRNNTYYINFTALAEYFDMVITGNSDTVRFMFSNQTKDNSYLKIGTNTVMINGELLSLDAPVFADGDYVYVPISFVKNYINGVNVSVDEQDRTISIKRIETLSSTEDILSTVYQDLSFTVRATEKSDSIDYDSLDDKIKRLVRYPKPPKDDETPPDSGDTDLGEQPTE